MSLPLPADFPVGLIIGKKGSNIKSIQTQSGARVFCDAKNMEIMFKGTSAQTRSARSLIEQQINDWKVQKSTVYPHPSYAALVLSRSFDGAATNSQIIRFKAVKTPTDTARDRPEPVYRLELNKPAGYEDDLVNIFARSMTITRRPDGKKSFYAQNRDWSNVASAYQDTTKLSIDFKDPGFKHIKLRVNYGTQLFYSSTKAIRHIPMSDLKLSDVLGMVIGHDHDDDFKACFSNVVSVTLVDHIRKSLPKLGFTQSSTADNIVCHAQDASKKQRLDFKFEVEAGDRKLRLVEIRSRYAKIAIVGFVHPITNTIKNPVQGSDFRLRLLGEYAITQEVRTEIVNLAKGSTLSETSGKIKSNLLTRFEFELVRHKKKELFTGKFENIEITVALVNVIDDAGSHWEVEVSSPDCDKKLGDRQLFDKIIAFCEKLRAKSIE